MERSKLIAARARRHWTLEQASERIQVDMNTLHRWEKGKIAPRAYSVQRLCEVYGMTAEELGLQGIEVKTDIASYEEFLSFCPANIAACNQLGQNNIALASQAVAALLPILKAIIEDSSQHRKAAASLASQALNLKHRFVHHLRDARSAIPYAEEAIAYARESGDKTMLVTNLRDLASIYEWPMEDISSHNRRKKGLELTEEAVHLLDSSVSPLVQSWVYIGLAKFQALNALKQEALASAGKAQEAFAQSSKDQEIPCVHIDEINLARQGSHVYAYLGQQEQTLDDLLNLVDGRVPVVPRTQCGILSEAMMTSLKLPHTKRDKALSIHLWRTELEAAQTLRSETYLNEARIGYRIMDAIWSDDPEISDLQDLLIVR